MFIIMTHIRAVTLCSGVETIANFNHRPLYSPPFFPSSLPPPSLPPSLSHYLCFSRSLCLFLPVSLCLLSPFSLSVSLSLSLFISTSLCLSFSLGHSLSLCFSLSLSFPFSYSLFLPVFLFSVPLVRHLTILDMIRSFLTANHSTVNTNAYTILVSIV